MQIRVEHGLRQALARLIEGRGQHSAHVGRPTRITPASVAREAGCSRNTIYTCLLYTSQSSNLAGLQAAFVLWVRKDPDEIVKTLGVTRATAADIAAGRNASASGFTCRNPLEGVAPGQQRGRLCTAWLGCFTLSLIHI